MSDQSTIAAKLAALSDDQINRRIAALSDYQLSMLRIQEDSHAAADEEIRVMSALSSLCAERARRRKVSS
jgi:hypothetical protein